MNQVKPILVNGPATSARGSAAGDDGRWSALLAKRSSTQAEAIANGRFLRCDRRCRRSLGGIPVQVC